MASILQHYINCGKNYTLMAFFAYNLLQRRFLTKSRVVVVAQSEEWAENVFFQNVQHRWREFDSRHKVVGKEFLATPSRGQNTGLSAKSQDRQLVEQKNDGLSWIKKPSSSARCNIDLLHLPSCGSNFVEILQLLFVLLSYNIWYGDYADQRFLNENWKKKNEVSLFLAWFIFSLGHNKGRKKAWKEFFSFFLSKLKLKVKFGFSSTPIEGEENLSLCLN